MRRTSSVPHMPVEFEAFLFAPVGEDNHGMLLSVLSALARLNVDPWREAAKLAGLPAEKATQRLTSLIAALPDGPSSPRDAGAIAAGLVTLLPHRRVGSQIQTRATKLDTGAATKSRATVFVVFLILALGAQYILASRQPPTQVDGAQAPVSDTTSGPTSPPRSGG